MSNRSYGNQNSIGKKRTHPDNMSTMDNKKIKSESPSKVIHIRQLPHMATEHDIKALGLPFGSVTNIIHMKSKQQAFLELDSVNSAKTMINYYQYVPPLVQNGRVYLQFSQHQELHTNKEQGNIAANGTDHSHEHRQNGTVLKVIVTNLIYPVTIDVLQQVFQRCGELQKIVTFVRNEQFHALIQYSNSTEASAAKSLFDRQNIYNGCNTLHVEFSKMTELTVKRNNEKMRDFTKPDIPDMVQVQAMQQQMNPGMLPLPGTFPPQIFPQNLNFTGNFPNIMGNISPNSNMSYTQPFGQPVGHQRQGSVLLVSNLNQAEINCDDLFILFGHYGDVLRVKILFNKKDTALIQFTETTQASTALQNLNGVTLYGQEMRVSRSKHDNVNMPKAEDEGKELTKEYVNSPLHRFKKPGSKNFKNIFPPVCTLHLSNIPESVTEDELQDFFKEYGTISNFRFFPKDRRMALIQMSSIEESLICLIKLHNRKLNESSHLRVSFAKDEMQ